MLASVLSQIQLCPPHWHLVRAVSGSGRKGERVSGDGGGGERKGEWVRGRVIEGETGRVSVEGSE